MRGVFRVIAASVVLVQLGCGGSGDSAEPSTGSSSGNSANPNAESTSFIPIEFRRSDSATEVELTADVDGYMLHWTADRSCAKTRNGCAESLRYLHDQRPLVLPRMPDYEKRFYWLSNADGELSSVLGNAVIINRDSALALSGLGLGTAEVSDIEPAFGKLWAVCSDEGCADLEKHSGSGINVETNTLQSSSIWSSTDGETWVESFTAMPLKSPLVEHPDLLAHKGILFAFGAEVGDDIYATEDGQNWEKRGVLDRHHQQKLSFSGQLWSFDFSFSEENSDLYAASVRRSDDGVNWKNISEIPPSLTENASVLATSDKLVVFSGADENGNYSVLSSSDGVTWTSKSSTFPIASMQSPVAVADEYHVLGQGLLPEQQELLEQGGYFVSPSYVRHFKSTDGLTWQLLDAETPLADQAKLFANEEQLFAYGGVDKISHSTGYQAYTSRNDLLKYSSTDGWLLVNSTRDIVARVKNQFVAAGRMYQLASDGKIWVSEDGKSWQHLATAPLAGDSTSLFFHQGKLGVGEGYELWLREDGKQWVEHTLSEPIFGNTPTMLSFGDRIYAMRTGYLARSVDGVDWQSFETNVEIQAGEVFSHNNSLYVEARSGHLLMSSDGLNWSQVSNDVLPFSGNIRSFKDRMWAYAYGEAEAWVSSDGVSWSKTTLDSDSARRLSGSTSFADRLWAFSGAVSLNGTDSVDVSLGRFVFD